jgi:cell wall-associated NlpC family hydrolase
MTTTLPEPGDIIFCHSNGFVGAMIRFGERLRSPLTDAYWNHVAIVVEPGEDGLARVVQAGGNGVAYASLRDIDAHYVAIPTEAFPGLLGDPIDRAALVEQAHALVGEKYGWLTILSIIVNIITPKWIRIPSFRRGGTFICSALGAWCLHAGGADIDTYDIYQIMPSEVRELAEWNPASAH